MKKMAEQNPKNNPEAQEVDVFSLPESTLAIESLKVILERKQKQEKTEDK